MPLYVSYLSSSLDYCTRSSGLQGMCFRLARYVHFTYRFRHAEVECLCDVDICTRCCCAAGMGKDEGMVQIGGERLTEGRGRQESVRMRTSSNRALGYGSVISGLTAVIIDYENNGFRQHVFPQKHE